LLIFLPFPALLQQARIDQSIGVVTSFPSRCNSLTNLWPLLGKPSESFRIEPVKNPSLASSLLNLRGRSQRDGSLGGEQKERECLLQVQADGGIGVAEITDGNVLTDV